MPVITTIKVRRGTVAAWASANPILAVGELGLETDTGIVRYGNGSTAFASLPALFFGAGSAALVGTAAIPGLVGDNVQEMLESAQSNIDAEEIIRAAADAAEAALARNADNLTSGTVAEARIAATIARLASPALTGNPTAPTATDGDNDTSIATTAFVQTAASAKVADAINDGTTGVAPSQNAVFDALALKAADNAVVHLTGAETRTGTLTLVPSAAANTPLVLRAATSQSGSILKYRNSTDTADLYSINAVGDPVLNSGRLRVPTTSGATESNLLYSAIPWTNGPPGQENYTDEVWTFGFNHNGSGSAIAPAQSTTFLQFESKFYQSFIVEGAAFGSEIHLNHVRPGGLGQLSRPLSFSISHSTGEIIGSGAGSFTWYDSANTVVDMQKHEGNKTFSLFQNYAFSIEPVATTRATMYLGFAAQPSILAIAGDTQTERLIDLRLSDNSSIAYTQADGLTHLKQPLVMNFSQNDGAFITGQPRATNEPFMTIRRKNGQTADVLQVWDHTASTKLWAVTAIGGVELAGGLTLGAHITITPSATNVATMDIGGTATEPSIFARAGSTQTARLFDLRKSDNNTAVKVTSDGVTWVYEPMVLNFSQNDGALITAQPLATNQPLLIVRRKNGQSVDIFQYWTHDAATKLWSVNQDGEPEVGTPAKGMILASPDGTRYRVTVANGGALQTAAA